MRSRFLDAAKRLYDSGDRLWLFNFGRGVKFVAFGKTQDEAVQHVAPLLRDGYYEYTDITNLLDEYLSGEAPFTEQNYVDGNFPGAAESPELPSEGDGDVWSGLFGSVRTAEARPGE